MPLGRAVPHLLLVLIALTMTACAATSAVAPADGASEGTTAHMPREIRLGAAAMVIQRVEDDVTREEVLATITPMIENAPVCMRWPALWMEQTRRTSLVVRYDLMTRDWGADAATAARARMDEFVEMGFMQAEAGADPGTLTYVLTETGMQYLDGLIEPGRRPSFCAPSERRLVDITAMEWGQYPCGTLHVTFTHVIDDWPSWARTQSVRERLAASWPALGAPSEGSVSLSRQWFRRQDLPPGAQNGGLRSACYDARRQEVVGDDLSLSLGSLD